MIYFLLWLLAQPVCPIEGRPYLTSYFGTRVHPVYGTRRQHNAIDIAANKHTPIRSVWSGVVVKQSSNRYLGRYVVTETSGGTRVLYAHMHRVYARVGRTLSKGDLIGEVGETGVATGPHLHLGMFVDGKAIDPLIWMNRCVTR